MKKILLMSLLLLALLGSGMSQGGQATGVRFGAALPSGTIGGPAVFVQTSGTTGIYVCILTSCTTSDWKRITVAGVDINTSDQVIKVNGGAIPLSASYVGTNGAGQFIPVIGNSIAPAMLVENPDTSLDGALAFYVTRPITLVRVRCPLIGTGSVTVQVEIRSDPAVAGTSVLTAPLVCDNTAPFTTSFAQASVAAGNYLTLRVPSSSGTPNWLRLYFEYQ